MKLMQHPHNIYLIIVIFILSGLFWGCSVNEPTNEGHQIKGSVYHNDLPLTFAKVTANSGAESFSGETNESGSFAINNVPTGEYILTVYKVDKDSNHLMLRENISVIEDLILSSLRIPSPSELHTPVAAAGDSVRLSWNSFSESLQFSEYKLLRKNNPGIDENNGELIYVGTGLNDTTFIDYLPQEGSYYYRLYVMNHMGRLGGSNITSYKLVWDMNRYFANASFEDGSKDWFLYNAFSTPIWANFVDTEHFWLAEIDSTTGYQSKKSLKLTFGKGTSIIYGGQYTVSTVPLINLKPNSNYSILYYVKYSQCEEDHLKIWLSANYGRDEIMFSNSTININGSTPDWQKIEGTFNTNGISQLNNFNFQINFGRFDGTKNYEDDIYLNDTLWLDHIEIHITL
jgi:hypothetical protein